MGLTVSPTSVGFDLDWDDSPDPDVAGYRIRRSDDSAGPFTHVADVSVSSYHDTTAPLGTSYYRITAVDSAGQESEAATADGTRTIGFRGATSATGRNTSSLTAARPGGSASGDVLLASVSVADTPNVTAPAGWSLVQNTTNGSMMRQATYIHVTGSGEPNSYTWSFSSRTSGAVVITAYVGLDTDAPIDNSAGQANPQSTAIIAPGVSVSATGALLTTFVSTRSNSTITEPLGMVEQVEAINTAGPQKVAVEGADQILAATGGTGDRVATASQAGVNIGHTIALRPTGSGPVEDTSPPTAPTDVEATPVSATQIDLEWTGSVDDVGVSHYVVYRDSAEVGSTTMTRFSDTGLQADTTYGYTVVAVDAAGNQSDPSTLVSATTQPAPTQITFIGATSGSSRSDTLTMSRPSGALPGHVLVAAVSVVGTPSLTPPTGWTRLSRTTSGSSMTTEVFSYVLGPGAPESFTWSFSASTAAAGAISGYSGVDSGSPIVEAGGRTGSGSSITAPSVTSEVGDSMLVGFFTTAVNASITSPASMSARMTATTNGPDKLSMLVADEPFAPVGATGDRIASASRSADNVGYLIALRPAG